MIKNQFSFFATKNDLLPILNDAKSKIPYIFSILEKHGELSIYKSPEEIRDLSIMPIGDQNKSNTYLLIDPMEQLKIRSVEQRNGGVKVFYDQIACPKSVFLRPGGFLNDSNCIIAGQIGTVSNNEWSIALYKRIFSLIKKKFTKIKSFYVGDEASKKLNNGYRLTTNIRSPVDYDLTP